jgi:DNA-binding GntR family transcriptional regulator
VANLKAQEQSIIDLLEPIHSTIGERTEPNYARVAGGVRAMIVSGEVRPGTWLRMQALAERFQVSVQPVREALQLLQGEGLLEIHPNRGAQVRGIDRRRLVHIYEIRGALESFMARSFADEASPRDIRSLIRIQEEHDAAVAARDAVHVFQANERFHSLINGRSGNGEVIALIRRYYDLTRSIRARLGFSENYLDRVRTDHHDLVKAVQRHDGSAAADIGVRHVMGTLHDLLTQLDGNHGAAKIDG